MGTRESEVAGGSLTDASPRNPAELTMGQLMYRDF